MCIISMVATTKDEFITPGTSGTMAVISGVRALVVIPGDTRARISMCKCFTSHFRYAVQIQAVRRSWYASTHLKRLNQIYCYILSFLDTCTII